MEILSVLWIALLGIAAGVAVALPYGPVGFIVIRRFYLFGMKSGMYSALGTVVSDAFYAIVVGFGLEHIKHFLLSIATYTEIGAGIILIILGIRSMKMDLHLHDGIEENHPVRDMASTAVINGLNPTIIFGFGLVFTIMSGIVGGQRLGFWLIALFIAGIAAGTLAFWYAVGRGIRYLRRNNRDRIVQNINYATGAILAALGVALLVITLIKIF